MNGNLLLLLFSPYISLHLWLRVDGVNTVKLYKKNPTKLEIIFKRRRKIVSTSNNNQKKKSINWEIRKLCQHFVPNNLLR